MLSNHVELVGGDVGAETMAAPNDLHQGHQGDG